MIERRSWVGLLGICTVLVFGACAGVRRVVPERPERLARLHEAGAWCIQLQGMDSPDALRALVRAPADLVVLEPTTTIRGEEDFALAPLVTRITRKRGPNGRRRLCLAYLNVGQAEDYRSYWGSRWRAPTAERRGDPAFLVTVDPDGWVGNFPVAYWDPAWRALLWGHADAPLDRILEAGFDGVYLDWVLGFAEPAVVDAAAAAGVDPVDAMAQLLADLAAYARRRTPEFVLVAQNAVDLALVRPDVLETVDGIAQEDLSYRGSATARWGDGDAGGEPAVESGPWSTAELGARLGEAVSRGLVVFTLDYALRPDEVARARRNARSVGAVPFVSQTPLDRLPRDFVTTADESIR